MKILKKIKNLFQTKEKIKQIKKEKKQIWIWMVWWIWFLSVSVLWLNILNNPIIQDNLNKNHLTQQEKTLKEIRKNFHSSAEKKSNLKKYFSHKEKIWKNYYLINMIEKISKKYEEKWKISYSTKQEKELFLRKIAKKYTLKNIEQFRKFSTVDKNVKKFSWRLLNKTLPVWFEVNMDKLEWEFVSWLNN